MLQIASQTFSEAISARFLGHLLRGKYRYFLCFYKIGVGYQSLKLGQNQGKMGKRGRFFRLFWDDISKKERYSYDFVFPVFSDFVTYFE